MTPGESKAQRPDLTPCVLSTRGVDRAGPLWGKPAEGPASEQTVTHPLGSDIATFLAQHGVAPGASSSVAAAARVTEAHRAALGATRCSTRGPATSNAWARLIAEAVAPHTWDDLGVIAHPQPPPQRPATASQADAGAVPLSGTPSRAVVLHASAPDTRRQPRLDRARPASESTVQTAARTAEPQEYGGRAAAAAAAAKRRALSAADQRLDVAVEARPLEGRGRPSSPQPRAVHAMRESVQPSIRAQTERMARMEEEAGGGVLRTHGPTTGALAPSAGEIRTGDTDHQGTEQHDGFLNDPVLVHRLCLQQPERLEAWGLVFGVALRIWRLMARAMRTDVDTTSTPWTGWDKQATERPTAFMMVTKGAGGLVLQLGHHRQLARPLAVVQHQSRTALDVAPACCTDGKSGEGDGEDGGAPRTAAEASPALVRCRAPADARQDHEQPPGAGPRPARGQGPEQPAPPHVGRAGLDGPGPLVWWENCLPEAHPGGSDMGLRVYGKG